jgi:AcrR family transcriptional regulator
MRRRAGRSDVRRTPAGTHPRGSVAAAQAPESPRQVARQAREEVYREHILSAAERVFAEQGFEAAKVQDISRLAKLSMGSIYSLFPSKDAIFASILEARSRELAELVREVVKQHPEPLDALESLAAAYIAYFFAHPDFLRMHLRTGAAWALQYPSYPGYQRSIATEIHELHRQIFARGVESGVFIEEEPAYLAFLLTGIDQIHLGYWVAGGMKGTREELLERFLRVMRKTFLRDQPRA